jgi:hypothetical protein
MANEAPLSVEAQLAVINIKLDTLLTQRDDHEIRIRKLEQFAWKQAGIVGLISSGIGAGAMKILGG